MQDSGPRSSRWARTLMNFQAGKFQFFFGDASAWKMRHFFMQKPLKLCHCKRVYASKQGDSFPTKPLNTNGRSAISKRDRRDKFQLSKQVWGIESSELMTWRARKPPRRGEVWSKESSASKLRFIEFMWYSIHLLLNSNFVCCFALSYQLITPERLICLHNLAHSSANLGLVGRFAVLICSDDIHVLDSWMIFWDKFKDAGCAW